MLSIVVIVFSGTLYWSPIFSAIAPTTSETVWPDAIVTFEVVMKTREPLLILVPDGIVETDDNAAFLVNFTFTVAFCPGFCLKSKTE